MCKGWGFSLLDFGRFGSAHSSSLSRSLGTATLPLLYQLVPPVSCPLWGWCEQSLTCPIAKTDVKQESFTHTPCSPPLVSSSRQSRIPDLCPVTMATKTVFTHLVVHPSRLEDPDLDTRLPWKALSNALLMSRQMVSALPSSIMQWFFTEINQGGQECFTW